jgi:rubrerythrin
MKIIKEGKTPPLPWMGRHACDKCGTVWELERSDVKLVRYHSDQREGDWFETQCPHCGHRKIIYTKH